MNLLHAWRHPRPSARSEVVTQLRGSGSTLRAERPRAVFIDKDGTLVVDVPYNVDPARLQFTPHALQGLQDLQRAGYALVVVTNQPGLAAGRYSRAEFARLQRALEERLRREGGIELAGFYTCPHAPAPSPALACLCRKPAPGMLRQAALAHGFDLRRSWMVGDILDDIEAGHRAGCRTVLMDVGNETVWRRSPLREPDHRAPDLREAARVILHRDAHVAAGGAALAEIQ
jgi:D-glycero-D-manno-heptose 1,7-bisphosphate phosphatase